MRPRRHRAVLYERAHARHWSANGRCRLVEKARRSLVHFDPILTQDPTSTLQQQNDAFFFFVDSMQVSSAAAASRVRAPRGLRTLENTDTVFDDVNVFLGRIFFSHVPVISSG
jgi:hypothetical protein